MVVVQCFFEGSLLDCSEGAFAQVFKLFVLATKMGETPPGVELYMATYSVMKIDQNNSSPNRFPITVGPSGGRSGPGLRLF